MYEYRELSRLTSTATAIIFLYLGLDVIASMATLILGPSEPTAIGPADLLALGELLMLIICFVVVGRWIYRASRNAHRISEQMTISPGWAVGWYFVPLMNLFKPLAAMREIWFASHEGNSSYEDKTPSLIGWWWGLWIASNILGNISFRMTMNESVDPWTIAMVELIATVVNVPLCLALVTIMRKIVSSQDVARHEYTFA